jgi:hypothetical protein
MDSVMRSIRCAIAGIVVLLTCGCLSLGGKTTYVQESHETPARLSSLEARVNGLEQAVYHQEPVPAAMPVPTP